MQLIFILCLVLQVQSASIFRSNVCSDLRSYGNPKHSKKCHYNPDLDSTPSEIAERYGFILDEHKVTTEDGYILTIFRIKSKTDDVKTSKQPVVLQHGVFVDGRSWFISGNTSLAFILANNEYDVWIPNFRGTFYSTKHVNPTISQKDYWNYSFHELGIYDIPAVMEYIAKITTRNDIIYIGHSMGTTTFMVYATIKPEHAKSHTRGALLLAPVINFKHTPLVVAAVIPFTYAIKNILNSLEIYAIGNLPAIQSFLTGRFCSSYPLIMVCQIFISTTSGIVVEQIRPEILPIMVKFFPVGMAINIFLHFAQLIMNNGRFQQFDYGPKVNMEKYNSLKPPEYDVEKVTIPLHIFAGDHDLLSQVPDVQVFYDRIKAPKEMHTYELSHLDYLYGKYVNQIYDGIMNAMKVLENQNVNHKVIK